MQRKYQGLRTGKKNKMSKEKRDIERERERERERAKMT